ncbi:MAG: pyridoxamine 5'-phosphate oxidase family protein [Planctomycetaceae bacterium]|jgi:nitroimidazol reductase NimA-like FMN-containing flavoprotein (pyridoxamine 5'-phosphate oxidase superfamily)|nr:pyridoxamine 5'-phosphate oxidase family protein [Planctomycetaceae bacterium]
MSLRPISYQARICTDENRINEFLSGSRVGVIGINADDYPYAVPVNYIWSDGCIYFHGVGSGKKTELLSEGVKVCFTVFHEFGTVRNDIPCHADTSYFSVMLFGNIVRITDHKKAADILNKIIEKFMPDFFNTPANNPVNSFLVEKYRSSQNGNGVAVYCIDPEFVTAKENQAKPENLISPKTKNKSV